MKVLMMPDYSRANAYQRELVKGLEGSGIQVTMCSFTGLPLLRAVWAHGKPDVLHLHWTNDYMLAGGWLKTILKTIRFITELLIVKALGIRIVWTVHNLSNHEKNNANHEIFVNRIIVNLYDQIIVHCSAARDAVIELYRLSDKVAGRVHIIAHGHYIDTYKNCITRIDARNRLGYAEDAIVFLFLGSIRPYKGIFELIDVFCKLDNPKACLLIVGNPSNDATKKQILDRCQNNDRIKLFLQYVPDDDIQIYMNAADAAVFPYTDILTSSSVLLAMSFGKVIVVPSIGCIPETLDARGSFLYNPDDPDGLTKAMHNVLVYDLASIGQYNRSKAEVFDWNEIAQATRGVYSNSESFKRKE